MSGASFEEITKSKPEKSLLSPLKKKGGRSNQGKITVRHRGGGAKRRLRIIDFKRDKLGIPGRVAAIEYAKRVRKLAESEYGESEDIEELEIPEDNDLDFFDELWQD